MRVLLDTNVILDSMLQRHPWCVEADDILKAAAQGQVTCAATPHSLATVFYVGRRVVGTNRARAVIRHYLQAFDVLPIDKHTLLAADRLAGSDFEDDVQIAAAVSAGIDALVTRNVSDFAHSPLSVLTPADLLQRLRAGGSLQAGGPGTTSGTP